MKLSSSAFTDQGNIPPKYTCQGENMSPPLTIAAVPDQAVSLALLVDDPDAATDPDGPGKTFDHWVIFNIDPKTVEISENEPPAGAVLGSNTAGQHQYTGPCPPNGTHRYFFKLFALNVQLELSAGAKKSDVEAAMNTHVLAQAELVGMYRKTN